MTSSHPSHDGNALSLDNEPLGRFLVRERELRGMSLEQISELTRISMSSLKELEESEVARLPARVFVVGYLRAYAQAIGMSPDEAVLRYEEQALQALPSDQAVRGRSRKGKVVMAVSAALLLMGGMALFLLRHS